MNLTQSLSLTAVGTAALLLAGCLVSATFVVDYEVDFSALSNFHHEAVDLTQEQIWQDHSDELDEVELVGLELTMTNSGGPALVSLYVDNYGDPVVTDPANLDSLTTIVLDEYSIPSGQSSLTYGKSLSTLQNVGTLISLAESGQFRFYALTKGNGTVTFGKAIILVTFTASET